MVSVKSMPEPTRCLVWLGKMVDLDLGVLSMADAAWESLLLY